MARLNAVLEGSRLEKLKELERLLADELDHPGDSKQIPQLARQYRDTIREIEEIEGTEINADEIGAILSDRGASGKPGAVR